MYTKGRFPDGGFSAGACVLLCPAIEAPTGSAKAAKATDTRLLLSVAKRRLCVTRLTTLPGIVPNILLRESRQRDGSRMHTARGEQATDRCGASVIGKLQVDALAQAAAVTAAVRMLGRIKITIQISIIAVTISKS